MCLETPDFQIWIVDINMDTEFEKNMKHRMLLMPIDNTRWKINLHLRNMYTLPKKEIDTKDNQIFKKKDGQLDILRNHFAVTSTSY